MRPKRIISGMLLAMILLAQVSMIPFNKLVYAEANTAKEEQKNQKFHYNQLTDIAKSIYNAIEKMYRDGILKTGSESYDLSKDSNFDNTFIEKYLRGDKTLIKEMDAARYAFYADYPEVFYVDFEKLSLRTTKDSSGNYHIYIGPGRYENYYIEGFNNNNIDEAIEKFNNRIDEIVQKVNNIQVVENENIETKKMKLVHDEIIYNTSYKSETDSTGGNEGFISTPYGVFVTKQAGCEGYARAYKTILDKLGINCVLVQGAYKIAEEAQMRHMWNYVQVENKWYAVDCMLDDPYVVSIENSTKQGNNDDREFENSRYFLVGAETMNAEHTALGTIEFAGNYIFKYPQLEVYDYSINKIVEKNDLIVKYRENAENYKVGEYYISYQGKGYKKASEDGNYIIAKFWEYQNDEDKIIEANWAYIAPDIYTEGTTKQDSDTNLYLSLPSKEYVQFAITSKAPGDYENDIKELYYQGTEDEIIVQSEKLHNINYNYRLSPYVIKQSPEATYSVEAKRTYHVTAVYNEDLEETGRLAYTIESTGTTGTRYAEITNMEWDGKRTISFNIRFREAFVNESIAYKIFPTGVVGVNSKKAPSQISFGMENAKEISLEPICKPWKTSCWETFNKPSILDEADFSLEDWVIDDGTERGTPISGKLREKILLATTGVSLENQRTMEKMIEKDLSTGSVKKSQTYDISLNIGSNNLKNISSSSADKSNLKISLGFPAGYNANSEGIIFKAYHFIKDNNGNISGIEEIPCIVTQYGLILLSNSFSPFAVAVVESDEEIQNKTAIITSTKGGIVEGIRKDSANTIILKEGEKATFTVKADEGYNIETITISGEQIEVTNKEQMEITVNYDNLLFKNNIIETQFVSEVVLAREEEKGEIAIIPTPRPATIIMPEETIITRTINDINKEVTMKPEKVEVENVDGQQVTYQWYKDGEKLNGETNIELKLKNITQKDEGRYTLKVRTTLGTSSVEVESDPWEIRIATFKTTLSKELEANLHPGEKFDIYVNISDLKNIEGNIQTLAGKLQYDHSIFDDEETEITGINGWSSGIKDNLIDSVKKFVTDSNIYMSNNNEGRIEEGKIVKIALKVREDLEITEPINKTITVTDIHMFNENNGIINSGDTEINVTIDKKSEPEKAYITSSEYVIAEGYITRIRPGIDNVKQLATTVEEFKEKVTTNVNMIFTNEKGEELGDKDIVKTGTNLQVGELHFKLVVTGDIDGNGKINMTDIGQVRLHLVKLKNLTGANLKATDINGNGNCFELTDLIQIKEATVGLRKIK